MRNRFSAAPWFGSPSLAKKTNLFKGGTVKNLSALRAAYQTAAEIHRQIKESESLRSKIEAESQVLCAAVESARKEFEVVAGGHLVGSASDGDLSAAQSKLDAAIAARDGATRKAGILHGAMHRLSVGAIGAKAELSVQAEAALSEITEAHECSIKKNEKLRQMLLEIYSAGIVSNHVQAGGVAGFAAQSVPLPGLSGWHDLLRCVFNEAFPEPSHDELEAALAAFKEKYGLHALGG